MTRSRTFTAAATRGRKSIATALAFLFAAGLSGCGGETSPTSPVTNEQAARYPEFAATKLPIPSVPTEVSNKFGKESAITAYRMGADLVLRNQMDGTRFAKTLSSTKASDLAEVRKLLTPPRQRDLDKNFACAPKGGNCYDSVVVLAGVGGADQDIILTNSTTRKSVTTRIRRDARPAVFDRAIGSPALRIDTDGRLRADFSSEGTFRVTGAGANYDAPLSNVTTLWFKRNGSTWLVDGWKAVWEQKITGTVEKP